jgi:bifunctional non-homologous end joining protein LigD
MLARSGRLPTRGAWSYEVKWDGFRAIVSTEGRLRVRSRRGWRMGELLPEFAALPVSGIFDGELVAFGRDGRPSFGPGVSADAATRLRRPGRVDPV